MTVDNASDSSGTVVVVDVANVMGARADGWWRDRAGAALRLGREVAELAARGAPGLEGARFVLVLEGRARDAAACLSAPGDDASDHGDGAADHRVRVISAPGSGDDTIVTEVAALAAFGMSCLVVTADRELRRRCEVNGARVVGPSWLLGLI